MSGQGWRKLETDEPIDLEAGGIRPKSLQQQHSAERAKMVQQAVGNLQPPEWFLEEHIAKQHRDIARTFTSVEEPGEAPDTQKMQRAIAEKLRQISDLEAKIASGHTPTPEQEEDLSKKAELEAQLAALGALLPQCSNKWAQMQCARDLSVSWESNKVYQAIWEERNTDQLRSSCGSR